MRIHFLRLLACLPAALALNLLATTDYVNVNNTNPVVPYTSWATAATNIQDAITYAGSGGTVLVTNGVYQYGGFPNSGSNRVYVFNNITVQSVNGPSVTTIEGYQVPGTTNGANAVRCVYLQDGTTLSGFTLTNGATQNGGSGGGVKCNSTNATITNCVIVGNSAYQNGGGAYSGTLVDCYLISNSAPTKDSGEGGGAESSVLINCILTGNFSGYDAGGAGGGCTLINCTVVGNVSEGGNGGASGTLLNSIVYYNFSYYTNADTGGGPSYVTNCCTLFANQGVNNFSNPPAFVDLAGGNFRLRIGSPCINAGNNSFNTNSTDLDGNPRIVGGTVDIGAYENQNTNTVHYVNLISTNPVAPYTNWSMAATNIQAAVTAAQTGDFVVAGDGTYNAGSTVVYGSEANRVALTNGITLLSLNGPATTMIVGGTQTRCVYVGSNSILSGFTITNGQASLGGSNVIREGSGGGIWCESSGVVSNCIVTGNFAGNLNNFGTSRLGGGIYGGTIWDCVLTNNVAGSGGGIPASMLWNCTVSSNLANLGGGAYEASLCNCAICTNTAIYNGLGGEGGGVCQCIVSNSTLMGNLASRNGGFWGGGAYQGSNFNCVFIGNTAPSGGGVYQGSNFNCLFIGNTAINGGGTYQCTNYNCVISGNIATNFGGGAYSSKLVNCTVTGNSTTGSGGGMYGGTALNSIVYLNSSPSGSNYANIQEMDYCCTAPNSGIGYVNIANDPLFVDAAGGDFRLKCDSPCIDAGSSNFFYIASIPTNDIRGAPRSLNGIDIGAYQYDPAIDQTPVSRAAFPFTSFAADYSVPFVAEIAGCPDCFWWDFGDGTTITNQTDVSHAWNSPGTFNVKLSAYYSSLGGALSATTQVQVVQQPIYYANVSNSSAAFPYTNWATAATEIQNAIAAGTTPGRLVLVTNGAYHDDWLIAGWPSAIILTNPVIVQSVNGTSVTSLQSGNRCAYMGSNSILTGFTLNGGQADNGGAIWCAPGAVVNNCYIIRGSAITNGGGAYQGTFNNCTFSNNSAGNGGGTYQATLYNCTLISNMANQSTSSNGFGGGACLGALYNCVIEGNTVNNNGWGGGSASTTLWNCTLSGNQSVNGGGAFSSTLYNCSVISNTTSGNNGEGGGVYQCTLFNCLVSGNSSYYGGGVCLGNLYNCTVSSNVGVNCGGAVGGYFNGVFYNFYNSIIYYNSASTGSNYEGNTLTYCDTAPLASGSGNITNAPDFVNLAAGNFHLQSNSPCINAGNNSYVATNTDLDGNPRIVGGTVDIGAYEFQSPTSIISYAWLQQYGLPTDGSADYADYDGTGMNVYQDWVAGLNPTNASSVLQMMSTTYTNSPSGIVVTWQSVSGINYFIQRSANLSGQPAFSTLQTNIAGQAGTTSYTDTTATNNGPFFYRVGVQ